MRLVDAIAANQRKHARYKRAEKVLRAIRLRIFDYEDEGAARYEKARRVMATCQRILEPYHRARRAAVENSKLQATPSLYEPGSR